jgi:enoyl-CoA hydratase/3-hydroxyacyl-CoA dehydrogenase
MSHEIQRVTIIGNGIMGREIAQVVLMGAYKVKLYDIDESKIERAEIFIRDNLLALDKKNKLNQGLAANQLLNNLQKAENINDAVQGTDLIIEAIPENMKLKQDLFETLSELAPAHTILASNTSNMPITKIALKSSKPEKIVGTHFFIPIVLLRAIELIKGEKTSNKTIETTEEFLKSLPCLKGARKIIKIEKETPGFVINRITAASSIYLNWLLKEGKKRGISYKQIDADVVSLQGGLGPYAKWDYLGLDVIYASFNYFAENLSEDFTPATTLKQLVEQGNLGRKTGKGFYEWEGGKPILNGFDSIEKVELFNFELFMAIQINEACRLLEEKVSESYKEIDRAVVAAMNMPGPFSVGKRHYQKWSKLLKDFSKRSGLIYLAPCELFRSGKFLDMK